MIHFTGRRGKAATVTAAAVTVAAVGALVLSQAWTAHGTPIRAVGTAAGSTTVSAAGRPATSHALVAAPKDTVSTASLTADTAGSASPGDDSQFVNTFGEYIAGHPVDIGGPGITCYPSIPGCPQYPLAPGTYGWQPECLNGTTDDLTDGCGYLFDNNTSSQIVRYATAGAFGALSTVCGKAAALCQAAATEVGVYIGDHQNIMPPGRCLYLHAPDVTNLWNLVPPLVSTVQARIVDCP